MASGQLPHPKWVLTPPKPFDIVTCYFPEVKPKGQLRLRPALVRKVLQGKKTGNYAAEVYFGTKNLRKSATMGIDLIIMNNSDLDDLNLPVATRFDLAEKSCVLLPWSSQNFGCWHGFSTPILGSLNEGYRKELAYCRMNRLGIGLV